MNGNFVEHSKVMPLSDRAFRLHVAGLCHATRNLTEGYLSTIAVRSATALTRATGRHVIELEGSGLWIAVDGGWQIKDYLNYNPTAEELKELSNKRREAGRKGGLASAAKRQASASSKPEASATANRSNHVTQQDVEPKAVRAGLAVVEVEQPPDFRIPDLKEMA
jgi:hypothetical protein